MIKLLVADDEMISCMFIKNIVQEYFPQIGLVSEAGNGRSAVEKALEMRPDIAVMDIEMPLMNGIEASRIIKETLPDCIIIFLTAFAEFEYARQAIYLGASEFVLKPVEEKELISALKKAVDLCGDQEDQRGILRRYDGEEEGRQRRIASVPSGGDRISRIMLETEEYIGLHYMDDISVESIAEYFQISPSHLSRTFKQYFDVPCKEYIIGVRVEKAKKYLASPILTVREVGCMVGYQDSNYFTKVFRKKTGMTPTEYRNQAFFLPDD